jgi:hypothetical protein
VKLLPEASRKDIGVLYLIACDLLPSRETDFSAKVAAVSSAADLSSTLFQL